MTKKLTASFTAYIPDKQNAISIHGNGGGQLTLEFSDSEIAQALLLVAMRNKTVKVTIEEIENPVTGKMKPKNEDEHLDYAG